MKHWKFPSFTGKRGICGVCDKACALTTDGFLRKHSAVLYAPVCPGSFIKPTRIVEQGRNSDD